MNIYEICALVGVIFLSLGTFFLGVLGFYSVKVLINLSKIANSTSSTLEKVNQTTIQHVNESLFHISNMSDVIEKETLPLINRNLENITDVTDTTREKVEMIGSLIDKLSVIGDALDQIKSVLSFFKSFKLK